MGWESNAIFQVLIIQGSAGSGLFAYSPSPGAGNLVASIAAVGGTDTYGNVYLAGDVSYGGTTRAVALSGNSIQFFSAPGLGGPWTLKASFALDTTTLIGTLPSSGLSLNAPIATGAAGNASILSVTNNQAAPTNPIAQFTASAAPDFTLGIQVFGDTNQRFRVDSDGSVHWGTGAVATDTVLSRSAAGVLSAGSGTLVAAVVEALAAASGNATLLAETAGDTNPRFQVLGSGSAQWGPGNAVVDTTLARTAAGTLTVTSTLKTSGLVVAGSAADQVALSNGLAGGDVLKVTNTTSAPTGPNLEVISQAAGDNAIGTRITGDGFSRLRVDTSGPGGRPAFKLGPGNIATDTVLEGLGVGVVGVPAANGVGFTGGAAPAAIASVPLLYGSTASRVRELSPVGHDTILSGTQTNVTSTTVTAAAFTALTNLFNIPANELAAFSVVEVDTEGIATWGSTQQTLLFGADRDSALYGNSSTILATAFAASTALNWEAKVRLRVLTAGAGGTASVMVAVTLSPTTGSRTVGDAVRLVRRTPSTAFDTTVAHTIGLGCQWGSTTGAPTITSDGSTYRRDGS